MAVLGFGIVAVQIVQLVVLRHWWWGWPTIGSGVMLHTHVWATIASTLIGVWAVRPLLLDGGLARLATAIRSPCEIWARMLAPLLLAVATGETMVAAVIAVLGRSWYGSVDWLLVVAGPCWVAAAVAWGTWVGTHVRWRAAWLVAPALPALLFVLGTQYPQTRRFLPLLPVADPFGASPLQGRLYLLSAAISVAGLAMAALMWPGHVTAAAGLVVGLVLLPNIVTVPQYEPDPAARVPVCTLTGGIEVCLPRAYTAVQQRFEEVLGGVVAQQGALFEGVSRIDMGAGESSAGTIAVTPAMDWLTASMLASDDDLKVALASGLVRSESCVDDPMGDALVLRTSSAFDARPTAVLERARESVAAQAAADDRYRAAVSELQRWDTAQLAALLAGRRADSQACAATLDHILGPR